MLAGKAAFVHRIGLYDVGSAFGLREQLASALAAQKFASIVLDWRPRSGEWPHLEDSYRLVRQLESGRDSVGAFAGVATAPRYVLLRAQAASGEQP